ncbi:MAG: hypothetical protein RLY50_154, partial [Actinomycetota bacterium]
MSKDRPVADGDNTGEVAAHAPVSVTVDNGVAHLVLSRPEKRNAVTFAMWAAIENEVSALSRNPEVRVLVVRGSGEHFC